MIVQSVQMYIIHKTLFYLSSVELCNSLLVLHISIDLMNFFIIEPKIRILIKRALSTSRQDNQRLRCQENGLFLITKSAWMRENQQLPTYISCNVCEAMPVRNASIARCKSRTAANRTAWHDCKFEPVSSQFLSEHAEHSYISNKNHCASISNLPKSLQISSKTYNPSQKDRDTKACLNPPPPCQCWSRENCRDFWKNTVLFATLNRGKGWSATQREVSSLFFSGIVAKPVGISRQCSEIIRLQLWKIRNCNLEKNSPSIR